MKNNKGFTLIELLAVIVVLAIIAVIATPMVLKTIDAAKKGAAKADAYVYASELEKYMVLSQLDPTKPQLQVGVTYQLSSEKYEVASLADPNEVFINDLIQVKGNKPTSGYVVMNSAGKIDKMEMVISSYPVVYENGECEVKGEAIEKEEDEVVVSNEILAKAKKLVYKSSGTCKTDGSTYNYMGGCYIKGSSTNNYVWYNGFVWRIMGINSDNTVRLIADEAVTVMYYGSANETYTNREGYIHDWLNEYYYGELNITKNIIQEGAYFCNESTNNKDITEGRTTCTSGSEVTAKVGMISIDEYLLAGANDSYLYLNQAYWTLTPKLAGTIWVIGNSSLGSMAGYRPSGVRPVINVSPGTIVTAGDGLVNSLYVLGEDKTTAITGNLGEKATSGEYVKLEGKTYRVVNKNDSGVKLILDGFYEEPEGTIYTIKFNTVSSSAYANKFSLSYGIGVNLNAEVLTWLGLANSDKIITTTYYQGDYFEQNATYMDTLKQSNGVEAKVGLIQVGDILASNSSTMLTKNYTTPVNYLNLKEWWTMSKANSTNRIWAIANSGTITSLTEGFLEAVRPVIVVRNDLNITGGTGTWNNPYQV